MSTTVPVSTTWRLERGATVGEGATRFAVWAPNAERVVVRVLTGAGVGEHALERGADGVHAGEVPGVAAGDDYAYALDGGPDRPDPASRWQPEGVHGPSRVVDPWRFAWTDAAWRGCEMAELAIYELHVGTFTDAGTFDAVIPRLRELRELGITAIEIMPVAQFPGARNWGYDGVELYAPQHSYGGPDALRRLVDAAHATGLAVVLDVVYNHVGPEGNYLGEFGPYFTDTYRTPWGRAVNYDGPDSDEVRRFVLDNARYWVTEFHIDALRLDAVHGIFDFGARHLLAELAHAVHAVGHALGRRVLVIAESDLNDPRLVRPPARGGFGLDAQWADDFHHAVHVALTGERSGYYAGYAGTRDIAAALAHRYVYEGQHAPHRRRRHGASAVDVPADRFVVFVQNHDQVGNRAAGERLAALVDHERLKLAAALLLLSPYVPLLFMGEEYGETRPFLYFVSHGDAALVEAVRAGRRAEFASFGWSDDVPDPQSEETFARSRLDRSELTRGPRHAQLLALHRDLLHIRLEEPALRPGSASIEVQSSAEREWITLTLARENAAALVACFNLAEEPREVPLPAARGVCWRIRFSTRNARYGGPSDTRHTAAHDASGGWRVAIPPLTAALYRAEEA